MNLLCLAYKINYPVVRAHHRQHETSPSMLFGASTPAKPTGKRGITAAIAAIEPSLPRDDEQAPNDPSRSTLRDERPSRSNSHPIHQIDPPRHQHHHRTTSSRSQRAGDDTNCHPHVRQEIDVIHEGAGPEGSCDVTKRWLRLRRTPMPRKRYRMPLVIKETRPKTERPKKAPRAETGDETKWATSLRVPGA